MWFLALTTVGSMNGSNTGISQGIGMYIGKGNMAYGVEQTSQLLSFYNQG